jgi:hypothetical protein
LVALFQEVFEETSLVKCGSCLTNFSYKSLNKFPFKELPEDLKGIGLGVGFFDL